MIEQPIEVAVLIVAYNSREDLARCLPGADRWAGEHIKVRVVVVDCASMDDSSALVRELFPEFDLIDAGENLGFAGGNNLGWEHVQCVYPRTKYVALLNPDTLPAPGWLDPLIVRLEQYPDTATCQPLITLMNQPDRINTAGNVSHYLGFGFISRCGEPIPQGMRSGPISHSSGAAMLTRADLLVRYGLFEPEMFLYCEDTDLCWKLTQRGYIHELVPDSRVAHRFEPGASTAHYYYLERNRWWLMLVYYKTATLVLLLPALLLMEAGQCWYAFLHGRLRDKWNAWMYYTRPSNRDRVLAIRHAAQARRTISDRDFFRGFTGTINYPTLRGPLVRLIANPLLDAYWALARRLIFW